MATGHSTSDWVKIFWRATPWMALSGVIPLVLAVLMVELHLAPDLTSFADLTQPASEPSVLNAFTQRLFIHAATVTGFLLVCGMVIAWFVLDLRQNNLAPDRRVALARFAIVYWACIVAAIIGFGQLDLEIYRITYYAIADLFLLSHPTVAEAMTGDFLSTVMSRQFYAAILPTMIGVAAVVAGAVVAVVRVEEFETDIAAFEHGSKPAMGRLRETYQRLQEGTRALGLVLVATTVTASMFFHLPEALFVGSEAVRVDGFAATLSAFWGTIFTFTLIAVYVPPYLRIQRIARRHDLDLSPFRPDSPEAGAREVLWRRVELLLPVLGPLAAGPAANLLQGLFLGDIQP